jgi:hypothetical protein
MQDYKKMYYMLFNEITDIIAKLQEIQRKAEEMFVNQDNILFTNFDENNNKD